MMMTVVKTTSQMWMVLMRLVQRAQDHEIQFARKRKTHVDSQVDLWLRKLETEWQVAELKKRLLHLWMMSKKQTMLRIWKRLTMKRKRKRNWKEWLIGCC